MSLFQNKTNIVQEGEKTSVRNKRVCTELRKKEEGKIPTFMFPL